jgi:hypothetical protein
MITNTNNPDPKIKPSLLEEIGKGWEWVVFTFKMLSRVGGPIAIAKTLLNTLSILIGRTWKQWKN